MTAPPLPVTMELEEHLPPEKRKLMAKYHRYEPKIKDSTAVQQAKLCFRLYFYTMVLGRVPKEEPPYFSWGSAYHKFREVLECEYGYGVNAPKIYDADKAQEAYAKAALEGLAYWKKHGKDQDPDSKFAFMTTGRLIKSFMVAFKHWEREKKQNRITVMAVEQPFNVQLSDGSYRSGKADQIIRWNGKIWGRDWKTSSQKMDFYARGLEPNDQFTGYTLCEGKLAGEYVQGQFVEVLWNSNPTKNKDNGPEIHEFTTSRTDYQLKKFEEELGTVNRLLTVCREDDVWPMCEKSCGFCPFHSVCSKSTEPAMMAQLEAHFRVRPWDNTKIGMDT